MQTQDTHHDREVLVIFRADVTAEARAQLENQYAVKSWLPPRIAVLANGGNVEQLRGLPEVEAVVADPADTIPESLAESERIFVGAWQTRQHGGGKSRRGEGLAWDAPGFLPPDPPKRG